MYFLYFDVLDLRCLFLISLITAPSSASVSSQQDPSNKIL